MAEHDDRAGQVLTFMGALAVVSVVAGIGLARDELVAAGAAVTMAAPLAALAGVAVSALRARDRLARFAVGALLVIAAGMLLAQ
jgi:hypothetical protein